MKFKIIPQHQYDIWECEKGDKVIYVYIEWGYNEHEELNENSSELFKNCKSIEEIQKILDDAVKKCTPMTKKDKDYLYYEDYWKDSGEDDVYDTSELAEELKLDWEILLNTSSGGAIRRSEIVFSKDVSDKEFDMELDFEEDNEKITLREACETWNDEILSYNDWSEGTVTYYKSPMKVVEVKD